MFHRVTRSLVRVPVPALCLGVLALGCGGTPEPPEEASPGVVELSNIQGKRFGEWVTLPGSTQPLVHRAAQVTASVEGRVQTILPADGNGKALTEGAHVEPGQVIVQLDDKIAQANLEKAVKGQQDLAYQILAAENKYQLAQKTLVESERANGGGGGTLIPPLQMETIRSSVHEADTTLQGLKAKEQSAQADIRVATAQLRYYKMRAPIGGHLGMIQVGPGQWVHVGQVITDIVDLDEIDVLCFAPPTRARQLQMDQPADVLSADTNPERAAPAVKGQVKFIAKQADPQTGSFPVKVRFPNTKLRLGSNTFVRVRILTEPRKFRDALPADAILTDQPEPRVVVVDNLHEETNPEGEKGTFGTAHIYRPILGIRDTDDPTSDPDRPMVEVLGLERLEDEEGGKKKPPVPAVNKAKFVVSGARGLEEGDKVKLKED
jgi:multidrug efflux pump subunit AcrA (membrane-fusion protein)